MDFFSVKVVFAVIVVSGTLMVSSFSQGTLCSCYTFENHTKSWSESERYCTNKGGHLVSMEKEKEWEFISLAIQNKILGNNEWYIGLFNNTVNWRWISDHNLTYDKWQRNEPRLGGKNCAVIAKKFLSGQKGSFKNVNCGTPKAFVCEFKQGQGDAYLDGCDLLQPKYCRNHTNKSIKIARSPKEYPVLFFVVIGLGILLAGGIGIYICVFYCKKTNAEVNCKDRYSGSEMSGDHLDSFEDDDERGYVRTRSEWKFTYHASKQGEEMSEQSQAEPATETPAQSEGSQNDKVWSDKPQQPEKFNAVHSADLDYLLPDPNTTSTCTALYSSVDVEQKKTEESKDNTMPNPCHKEEEEQSEQPVKYARVDKSRKTKAENGQRDHTNTAPKMANPYEEKEPVGQPVEYAIVDKPRKTKAESRQIDNTGTEDKMPSPCEEKETVKQPVAYPRVDKSKKSKAENRQIDNNGTAHEMSNPCEEKEIVEQPVVYARVDKSKKKKAGSSQVEVMYAKVDRSDKTYKVGTD